MNKQKQINDLKSELMKLRDIVDALDERITKRVNNLNRFGASLATYLELDWDVKKEVLESMFSPDEIVYNYKFKKLIKDKKNGK